MDIEAITDNLSEAIKTLEAFDKWDGDFEGSYGAEVNLFSCLDGEAEQRIVWCVKKELLAVIEKNNTELQKAIKQVKGEEE